VSETRNPAGIGAGDHTVNVVCPPHTVVYWQSLWAAVDVCFAVLVGQCATSG